MNRAIKIITNTYFTAAVFTLLGANYLVSAYQNPNIKDIILGICGLMMALSYIFWFKRVK